MTLRLYFWQRLSAAVMAPMVLVHLAILFYATRRGLSAADILERTRGSIGWFLFYGAFVLAAAVHASIGVRNVLSEWSPLHDRESGIAAILFGLLLFVLGLRAVMAVVLA
jgi:succinate dehydrogenase subunit C